MGTSLSPHGDYAALDGDTHGTISQPHRGSTGDRVHAAPLHQTVPDNCMPKARDVIWRRHVISQYATSVVLPHVGAGCCLASAHRYGSERDLEHLLQSLTPFPRRGCVVGPVQAHGVKYACPGPTRNRARTARAPSGIPGNRDRCVAAPDGLKNENFCRDCKILTNPIAERPAATRAATVLPLSMSDADALFLKPHEAVE